MLNKLTTSGKLYLLILITAASLIGLGLYGINDLKKMNQNARSLYADRVLCMQQLANVRYQYLAEILPMPLNVKNHVFTFDEAQDRLRKAMEVVNANWHNYKRTFLTPQEGFLAMQTDTVKIQADKSLEYLISILSKKDTAAIDKLIQNRPSYESEPIVIKLNQLMALQTRIAKQIFNNNGKNI